LRLELELVLVKESVEIVEAHSEVESNSSNIDHDHDDGSSTTSSGITVNKEASESSAGNDASHNIVPDYNEPNSEKPAKNTGATTTTME